MRCRKVRSFLSTYCRGETDPKQSVAIKRHLDDCSACRREESVYRSMSTLMTQLPKLKTSDEFTAKLFQRIGHEGMAGVKTRAYLPGRIPRLGTARLALAASTAIVVLMLGVGIHYSDRLLIPDSPQMVNQTVGSDIHPSGEDGYLTAQPTHNPLLNEHKSVSRMVEQYNRWREYSRSVRGGSGSEQFFGGGASFASARSFSEPVNGIRIRPVVKSYLTYPE
jgi:hypothetical protein